MSQAVSEKGRALEASQGLPMKGTGIIYDLRGAWLNVNRWTGIV
jgi:hypothetical protein